jgi:hypothetical protein
MNHRDRFPLLLILCACLGADAVSAQVSETLKLGSSPAPLDGFGTSVAMYTDRLLIGAPGDDTAGVDAGAAWILERQADGSWATAASLFAGDAAAGDAFGSSVAIFADFAVVCAAADDAAGTDAGFAYVFERQLDGTWLQAAHLLATDGAAFDAFGEASALWVSTVLVGAPGDDLAATADPVERSGAVYAFQRQLDGTWPQVAKLNAADQGPSDAFGTSVSINGSRIIAGAPGHAGTGAAYVFEGQGPGAWGFTHKFLPDAPGTLAEFGLSVSVSGSRALAAAPGEGGGVAYVFRQVSGVWNQEAKLAGADSAPDDGFARHAQLGGDRVLVSAPLQAEGAAYVFERQSNNTWLLEAKLKPSSATPGAGFGSRGVVFQERALVGAPQDAGDGSAFLYQLSPLQIDTPIVHVNSGGAQTLFLDAGHLHAGTFYWLLGSASGSVPGVPLASGLVLPLNPDAYLNYTFAHANLPPLSGSLGLLDLHGLASATFTLPPNSPASIVGLPVFHAFLVLQPGTGMLRMVSNAQPVIFSF